MRLIHIAHEEGGHLPAGNGTIMDLSAIREDAKLSEDDDKDEWLDAVDFIPERLFVREEINGGGRSKNCYSNPALP